MIDFSKYFGCIPRSEHLHIPPDQKGAKLESCPFCNLPMWVSDIKRNKRDEHNMILICWICLFDLLEENGINPKDCETINVLKLN